MPVCMVEPYFLIEASVGAALDAVDKSAKRLHCSFAARADARLAYVGAAPELLLGSSPYLFVFFLLFVF